jgi:hypothetical protein
MTKRALILTCFVFLFGLQASKVVSASGTPVSSSHGHSIYASDDEQQQDVYNAGEGFYIWTTTSTKVA